MHAAPEFEEYTGSKIAALSLRMTKSMWDSGQDCALYNRFGHGKNFCIIKKERNLQ